MNSAEIDDELPCFPHAAGKKLSKSAAATVDNYVSQTLVSLQT
jgi:hypothetical protein